MPFAGDIKFSEQTGDHGYWMLCDGRTVASSYNELIGVIVNRHGAMGQLPNFKKKFPVGADESDAAYNVGDAGGNASSSLPATTGTGGAHDHGANTGGKTHNTTGVTAGGVPAVTDIGGSATHSHSITSEPAHSHSIGGNVATIPPYIAVNAFICWHTYGEPGV